MVDEPENNTSNFRIAASAFAFCRFSQAVIFASSLLHLDQRITRYQQQDISQFVSFTSIS
jgi:hypothetical protein